jgi:6-bladed beta-propeller
MHRRSLLVTVAALVGCVGEQSVQGPSYSVIDSAGVELVVSHRPQWTPEEEWRITRRPILQIGDLDGPLEFTFGNVEAVGWLGDGRIFVGDGQQESSTRVFSPDGSFLSTIGRRGDGPGELQSFLTVAPYRGDSLFVYDYMQRAVSIFGPDLQFGRRFPNPIVTGNYWISSALSDGQFLVFSPGHSRFEEGPGLVPDSSDVILLAPSGFTADTIAAFEQSVKNIGPDGRQRPLYLQPWGSAIGYGDEIITTEGKTFQYTIYDTLGRIRRIVRKDHERVVVTDAIIEDFKIRYTEALRGSREFNEERVRKNLATGMYNTEVPATGPDILVDTQNHVWVGRHRLPGLVTTNWEVFDHDGVWLGTVETPDGLRLHAIGRDRIVGVAKDDFDVPYVQVYGLNRR